MKDKIIVSIMFLFGVITVASSIVYLSTKKMIPGLTPISLIIIMLCSMYIYKKQYNEGKISKKRWNSFLIIELTGIILGTILGIIQIIEAIQ